MGITKHIFKNITLRLLSLYQNTAKTMLKTRSKTISKTTHAPHTQKAGNKAEDIAREYLLSQGFNIVLCNFYSRHGEIDLIALDNGIETKNVSENSYGYDKTATVVFIEVRYRKNALYGSAIESVTYAKQQKIIKTAQFFMLKHKKKYANHNMRFDVIGITGTLEVKNVAWIQNAFGS